MNAPAAFTLSLDKIPMISTRVAVLTDIPALVAMMREFYAESNYALDARWAAEAFSVVLRDSSRGIAWIVSEGEEPMGYVVVTFRLSMEFGGSDAFIDDLFVSARHRRRGIARTALETAFADCRRRGVLAIHVETGADSVAAKSLYRSFGLEDRKRLLLTTRLTTRCESLLNEKHQQIDRESK
ncbi:GNAT family N-acetyltransferase [Phragmitibacter flavus]|uniref:GNAT family N-acetyltransferase n=1 Tax=Phragmitibacter flavus TaxID=2576071 RepID=UPI0010FE3E15|nr:GNAT family N-acetyltransferase [Phragmitibacter flavus]